MNVRVKFKYISFVVTDTDINHPFEDQAQMKLLERIEDNKLLQTTIFNYSIYVTPTLDVTPVHSNETSHQTTKSRLRSSSPEHQIEGELSKLILEYAKARQEAVKGLEKLEMRIGGPQG